MKIISLLVLALVWIAPLSAQDHPANEAEAMKQTEESLQRAARRARFASDPQKWREAYVARTPLLSAENKAAILAGRYLIGMTRSDVIGAVGEPIAKEVEVSSVEVERWHYAWGLAEIEITLTFENGRLVRWRRVEAPPKPRP